MINTVDNILSWINSRFPTKKIWDKYANYPVPKNLNLLYIFGSLALIVLFNQVLTGIWLTMFYTPTAADAFNSIEYIMRDVHYGWLLRYMHSTGASLFFVIIYMHMFRALCYGSYQKPRELVWIIGMLLFILLLMEAFFGYLLPWGQMSYWGAQVITSIFSAIPFIGDDLVTFIRGDFTVSTPTLQRFFALHIIAMPLLLIALIYMHIIALHHTGSTNPSGIDYKYNKNPEQFVKFHPFYTIKDLTGIVGFLIVFFGIVFFAPTMGGYFLENTNFVAANPLLTPEHIAPVWYLTPFYAILRAIPSKGIGVIVISSSILILFCLPWLDKGQIKLIRQKSRISKILFCIFILSFIGLGYLGTIDVTPIRQFIARIFTIFYFAYFLWMPIYSRKGCR